MRVLSTDSWRLWQALSEQGSCLQYAIESDYYLRTAQGKSLQWHLNVAASLDYQFVQSIFLTSLSQSIDRE